MGIDKTKLLAHEYIYCDNINSDIENHIKNVLHALHFSKHNLRRRSYIMTSLYNHGMWLAWT